MAEIQSRPQSVVSSAAAFDPRVVADLMLALERVFRVGVYYPHGHGLFDQIADSILRDLARVCGKSPSARFELVDGNLHLQGVEVDSRLRGVGYFQTVLDGLGIVSVEIDCEITAADLHRFVSRMLAYRNDAQGTRIFKQIEIVDMPATVHIQQREFLARQSARADGGGIGDPLHSSTDSLLAELASHGLDEEELDLCQQLLADIPADFSEFWTASVRLRHKTKADFLRFLLKVFQCNGESTPPPDPVEHLTPNDLDTLQVTLEVFRRRSGGDKHRAAIELLTRLARRCVTLTAGDRSPANQRINEANLADDDCTDVSLADLRAALADCARKATAPPNLLVDDCLEQLSILMQMLGYDLRSSVWARIRRMLRDILSEPMQASERQILIEGLRQHLDGQNRERMASVVTMIINAMEGSKHITPMGFLYDVCQACSPPEIAEIWPFLVNEILLAGRWKEPRVFREACKLVASQSEHAMQVGFDQLEQMEALRNKRFALDIFTSPLPALYPVYALLLESTFAGKIGDQLLGGLRRFPPGWLGEAIVPLLPRFQPPHRRLLAGLLRHATAETPPASLAENAARIVAANLPVLTRKERKEPWVPATIRAIARLPVAGAEALLRSIAGKRRWLILHEWPKLCREAARETLAKLTNEVN